MALYFDPSDCFFGDFALGKIIMLLYLEKKVKMANIYVVFIYPYITLRTGNNLCLYTVCPVKKYPI